MFRDYISKPIDPIPSDYVIASIKMLDFEPDYSLVSLGLAMLKKRVPDYKGISGKYYFINEKKACIADFIETQKSECDYPLFCYYKYSESTTDDDDIKKNLSEYKEKKSISAFVKEKTGSECLVLYHEEKNVVGIFVNSGDIRLYHLMLSFISLYFPSLFKETPLDDDDYAIIKSLSKKDKNDFVASVSKALEPYRIEFRKLQLVTFMKNIHEIKIRSAENQMNSNKNEVERYEEAYSEAIRKYRKSIVEFEGLKATESYNDAEEKLVEDLTVNKNIRCMDFSNNNFTFAVTSYLNNYNSDAWDVFKARGTIYDGAYGGSRLPEYFQNEANRKLLLDNIFAEEPSLMVRICGNYTLQLENCRVTCKAAYPYVDLDPVFENYLPNPHILYHACLGGYKEKVMETLKNRDYSSAIELCQASAGSVNLDETTMTFRPFLGQILTSKKKILVTKSGQEMTPEEALAWLSSKKEEE